MANEHQIILAADVTDQANDVRQAVPIVDQARANLEAAGVRGEIKAALGDAGYYSEANATDLKRRGIEPYLATERLKHHEKIASAPRGRIPDGLSAKQRMARKLRTKVGREMYAKREGMIEPIFGQLKQALGFRQFSMRGLASMKGEWRLMATVHNLLKLWRRGRRWRWRVDARRDRPGRSPPGVGMWPPRAIRECSRRPRRSFGGFRTEKNRRRSSKGDIQTNS